MTQICVILCVFYATVTTSFSLNSATIRTSSLSSSSVLNAKYSLDEATSILAAHDAEQMAFTRQSAGELTAGEAASKFVDEYSGNMDDLRDAVRTIVECAAEERASEDISSGRIMLGICGTSVEECIGCLKSWVTNLDLPRGLLHGADVAGVPIDTATFGRAFIKYNTGGAMSWKELRESGKGFDALWIPGDAMLEGYDGDYRGVYLNAELQDDVFRQYGLLSLNLFD